MKIVLGIFLLVLLLAAIVLYVLFMLNTRSLIPCGDIAQNNGTNMTVTRVYASDLNGKETLTEIVNTMNDNEDGSLSAERLTEILAEYQEIIYAPVFSLDIEQADSNTYILSGSVYNAMNEDGEPDESEFKFRNLALTAGMAQGKILAAQNIYEDQKDDDDDEDDPEFVERRNVVDPVILSDGAGAAFAFRNCDSFRLVFTNTSDTYPPSITLAFTYDIVANNPLSFTSYEQGVLGVVVTVKFDELGRLTPQVVVDRTNIIVEDE